MKQLIVLGNGFDLACGLKSSYSDFFLDRFKKLFSNDKKRITRLEELEPDLDTARYSIISFIDNTRANINQFSDNRDNNKDTDYFMWYKKKHPAELEKITRWDVFFLFADFCVAKSVGEYKWLDVESLIFDVISMALKECSDKDFKMQYKEKILLGEKNWKGIEFFNSIVYFLSYTGYNTQSEIITSLFNELKKFEDAFAIFIASQIDLNREDTSKASYVTNAVDLLRRLVRSEAIKNNLNTSDSVDVLSFNYSLDERFLQVHGNVAIHSWTNIHGIASYNDPNAKKTIKKKDGYSDPSTLPAPIFGIDNHDIITRQDHNDLRILFTKSYRVIENGINEIRASNGYSNVDLITIYGHSLGRADYSYFETIFDECNLYDSNIKLEYWYYSGSSEEEKTIKKQNAITKLYNLLLDYGQTLGETHGANIINKLNLENRLSVEPMNNLPS